MLAAGRGKRLQPHTDNTPKPLLVHRGKPTLDYLLDSSLAAGVQEIILVAHHLSDQIVHYAKVRSAATGQSVNVVYQSQLAGTAHALETVVDANPQLFQEPFLLSATDYLVPKEFFPELLGFHQQHEGDLTVSMKSLQESELANRSSIRFHKDDSIAEIVEKPAPGTAPSHYGANLTFIVPPSMLKYIDEVPLSVRGEREIQHAINAWLRDGGRAQGLLQAVPAEWQPTAG